MMEKATFAFGEFESHCVFNCVFNFVVGFIQPFLDHFMAICFGLHFGRHTIFSIYNNFDVDFDVLRLLEASYFLNCQKQCNLPQMLPTSLNYFVL